MFANAAASYISHLGFAHILNIDKVTLESNKTYTSSSQPRGDTKIIFYLTTVSLCKDSLLQVLKCAKLLKFMADRSKGIVQQATKNLLHD